MRIGINGCIFGGPPSGATMRFAGLYREVFREPGHEYIVFEPRDARLASYFEPKPWVEFVRTALPSGGTLERFVRGKLFWRDALMRHRIDVFDTSSLPFIGHPRGVTILSVHDIRAAAHPELQSLPGRLLGRAINRSAILGANVVVTVSAAMKDELLAFEPRANVRVVPNAIDWEESPDEVRVLAEPFILSVGHLERRKNYPRLIEAFHIVAKRGYAGHLYIVGTPLDDAARVRAAAQTSPLRDRIHIASGVSRMDLLRLYGTADLFVFPSLYEGFGIPILEAMRASCPFVLSDLPVFREITANRGVYFSPLEPFAMADAMDSMLRDENLQKKCRVLAAEMREVYTWHAVAKKYSDVLHEYA